MDEFTADAFANRDEPAPTVAVSGNPMTHCASSDGDDHSGSRREKLKEQLSGSKLKEKIHDVRRSESGSSLQDRLFSK